MARLSGSTAPFGATVSRSCHDPGTDTCERRWLTCGVLSPATVNDILERIDLGAPPACPMCLFHLACAIDNGQSARRIGGLLNRTTRWVWEEIDVELRAQLARLQMRGVVGAADALNDVNAHGWRSRVVRAVVERLARAMAEEMRASESRRDAVLRPFEPRPHDGATA